MKLIHGLIVDYDNNCADAQIIDYYKSYQEIVGGIFSIYEPFDDNVAIVCHDEGKIIGLPATAIIKFDIEGEPFPYEVICGRFAVVGVNEEGDFISLTDQQIERYSSMFTKENFQKLYEEIKANVVC